MLSHTLDAVTGIKVDYALEVRITFIPVAPVQLKPHWMDHIALIHRYNLWTGPFSRLMCTSRPCPLMAILLGWLKHTSLNCLQVLSLTLFSHYVCSLWNWEREHNLPFCEAAGVSVADLNYRIKTGFGEEPQPQGRIPDWTGLTWG